MLEAKNLTKIYRPKKGVPVTAVNNVSLKFSDTGMVFLLGKSGSGKSTLLNLLGGLDSYDDGEILISGVSSKAFTPEHFDSYRNTYLGFIFQEYNILDEFTVGANVALAIELQGKKASDSEINRILSEVDLDGYGMRKPGELSGGQKQRVAIARALVKDPDIILADEPTGALDSATGRQVLETLKKLSKKKLVIVVSHDREFAENYADRIIELADGRVIGDTEYFNCTTDADGEGLSFGAEGITVSPKYRIKEDDLKAINEYLEKVKSDGPVAIYPKNKKRKSAPFDEKNLKCDEKRPFRLIKSKLPMKSAFRIGAGALKYKKIRLVITILLSCIAFGLFGLADTFGAYDHITTCTDSIIDTGIDYASVSKAKKLLDSDGSAYYQSYGCQISQDDIEMFSEKAGINMIGIFEPKDISLNLDINYDSSVPLSETDYSVLSTCFSGFAEADGEYLAAMGYETVAGRLPMGDKNEIAITSHIADTFITAGYKAATEDEYQKISDASELVGKTLRLGDTDFTVVGIIDTHFDTDRYLPLTVKDKNISTAEELIRYALAHELSYSQKYSLHCAAVVGEGFIENNYPDVGSRMITDGYLYFLDHNKESIEIDPYYMAPIGDLNRDDIVWFEDGKDSLKDREIVIASDLFEYLSAFRESDSDVSPYGADSSVAVVEPSFDALKEAAEKTGEMTATVRRNGGGSEMEELEGYRIVGYVDSSERSEYYGTVIAKEEECRGLISQDGGRFDFAVGVMPKTRDGIKTFLEVAYDESGDVKYPVKNSVTYELDSVNDVFVTLSKIFLYVGIAFAIFTSIMLSNFIATSISYKKQEIGILRAIGSRSNDVFRIFFSESFIIAMINFVLSSVGVFAATAIINSILRTEVGLLITVLSFTVRQVALILLISIAVAALASYIPVKRIASKRPIDAIRNR